MKDTCKDKTSLYEIRQIDDALIKATKCLGNFLLSHPQCTVEQKDAIGGMLSFLNNLPLPPGIDFNGEFGFEIKPENSSNVAPIERSWFVSVCRACFEIGSVYTDSSSDDDLCGLKHEFEWCVCPGEKNRNGNYNADLWIAQVSNPLLLLTSGYHLEIEASAWTMIE